MPGREYVARTQSIARERDGETFCSFSRTYRSKRTIVLSVGRPVTVTCEVMSNDSPISESFGLLSMKEIFSMFGRPSMSGLTEAAGRTRDSAMENEFSVAGCGFNSTGFER